jgi:hypothetical protein
MLVTFATYVRYLYTFSPSDEANGMTLITDNDPEKGVDSRERV